MVVLDSSTYVLLVFIFIYILKALSNLSISEKSTFLPQPFTPYTPSISHCIWFGRPYYYY